MKRWYFALLGAAGIAAALGPAAAQQPEIRISRTTTMAYLPLMVVEHEKLLERHAAQAGIPNLKVSVHTFTGPSAQFDALFSGNVDVVAVGSTALITLWARTKGTANEVKGISALASMPITLSTKNPNVKSIRDFTDKDRIALPAVKLTGHAIALQMAAAQEWGREHYDRLDAITVSLSHPDATAAMLAGKSEINAHFASSPFYYIELANPAVHRVLHSYEVAGGRHTNGVLMTSKKFYEANPKTCAAVVAALNEANAFIKANPRQAAEIYIAMTREKRSTLDEIEKMVTDPDVDYTTTPINVMKFIEFMNLAGTVKKKPASWKDLFFPTAYAMPGS